MTPLVAIAVAVASIAGVTLLASYWARTGVPDPSAAAFLPASASASAAVAPRPALAPARPPVGTPVRLRIAKLGVDAQVVVVGVDKTGTMESPKGPTLAGWYGAGTRPGERGSAVIAGHSGYRDGREAIFDRLGRLAPGDAVVVVDEAGTELAFVVREARRFDPAADAEVVFNRQDGRFLNLVTCTGEWNAEAGTHSQRLVVFCDAVR